MDTPLPACRIEASGLELGARLRGVSLGLATGECIVVTGPNGSGKSSLISALLGLVTPERGDVQLDGVPLRRMPRRDVARRLAWLPQNAAVSEPRLAEELVAVARFHFGEPWSSSVDQARRALGRLDAGHLAARRSDRLSGGELQRVLLSSLLAQASPLLLVDEPANHLDPLQQVSVYKKLGQLWQAGHGLLVVTHELGLARLLGDPGRVRVLGLEDGALRVDEPLDSPTLPAQLGRLSGVPFRAGSRPGSLGIDWEGVE